MWRELGNILCDLDPKLKVKGKKKHICDGVPWTAALVLIIFVVLANPDKEKKRKRKEKRKKITQEHHKYSNLQSMQMLCHLNVQKVLLCGG